VAFILFFYKTICHLPHTPFKRPVYGHMQVWQMGGSVAAKGRKRQKSKKSHSDIDDFRCKIIDISLSYC